jgi:hypothetical protein
MFAAPQPGRRACVSESARERKRTTLFLAREGPKDGTAKRVWGPRPCTHPGHHPGRSRSEFRARTCKYTAMDILSHWHTYTHTARTDGSASRQSASFVLEQASRLSRQGQDVCSDGRHKSQHLERALAFTMKIFTNTDPDPSRAVISRHHVHTICDARSVRRRFSTLKHHGALGALAVARPHWSRREPRGQREGLRDSYLHATRDNYH